MSVMIDIQMPENCLLCPVHREKGENIICPIRWSIAAFPGKGRPSWCPLTETEASEVEYLPGDKIYHVYYEAAFPDEAVSMRERSLTHPLPGSSGRRSTRMSGSMPRILLRGCSGHAKRPRSAWKN